MNNQVDQMITEETQAMKMKIKRYGKIGNKARRPEIPDAFEVMDISYRRIFRDGFSVVKMKGT